MSKTYAAIHLPPEKPVEVEADPKLIEKFSEWFESAKNNLKSNVKSLSYENLKELAKNMGRVNATAFTMKYAAGAVTDLISGQPVTSKTMLDALFNTYAPALNAGLAQTGYNSLIELRTAVHAGNINVANFIQGFSDGLSVITNSSENVNYESKYGEEIPIDVITQCKYEYGTKVAEQKIADKVDLSSYIGDLAPVKITLSCHVYNENAEFWNMNDISNKIVDIMLKKQIVTFRIGKGIYENCIISRYIPTITSVYDLSFELDVNYNHQLNACAKSRDKKCYITNNDILQEVVYGGIVYGVEKNDS